MRDFFSTGDYIKTDPYNTQLRAEQTSTKTKSSTAPSFGKPVSKLRFLAAIPRYSERDSSFVSRIERCEFNLGVGPCGRYVTGLWFDMSSNFLTITQESEEINGVGPHGTPEFKEFTYLITDITGRIEAVSI